jgi:hypothetical protein
MKIHLTQAILAATLAGTAAYVNVAPATKPAFTRQTTLQMARSENNPIADLSKNAMTLFTASAFAFSAATTVLPAPAMAAAAKPVVEQKAPAKKQISEKEQEKIKLSKMSQDERAQYSAKKTVDLSGKTIAEYQKFLSEAKIADSKAAKGVEAAEKVEAPAKKAFITASDKLAAAKNQQMPASAIKELSEKVGT